MLEQRIHQEFKKALLIGGFPSHIVISKVFAARFLAEKGCVANGGVINYTTSGNFDNREFEWAPKIVVVETNDFDFYLGYVEIGFERQHKWNNEPTYQKKIEDLPLPKYTLDFPLT